MAGRSSRAGRIGYLATVLMAALLSLATASFPGSLTAQEDGSEVHLFTVVSARDEIVVGLSEAEVPALAGRNPVAVIGDLLSSQGRLNAWRYGPSRGEDGVIRQVALHRVAIFAGGTLRIELYRSEQEVVPPSE